MRELVIVVLDEFARFYPPPPAETCGPALEDYDVVWHPHREAPSLLGDRPSKSMDQPLKLHGSWRRAH